MDSSCGGNFIINYESSFLQSSDGLLGPEFSRTVMLKILPETARRSCLSCFRSLRADSFWQTGSQVSVCGRKASVKSGST